MSAAWSNPPGDPIADVERLMRQLDEIPKPTCDRFKVSSMDLVAEHLDLATMRVLNVAAPAAFSIPVVDPTVEPGWIEAWLGDECTDRIRIA